MAATADDVPFANILLQKAITSYVPYPPLDIETSTQFTVPLKGTGQSIRTGNPGVDTFLDSFFRETPNPVVRMINDIYVDTPPSEDGHPITGEGATQPIVWIVVPFQSSPGDDRAAQREMFITHMVRLRKYLAAKGISLRVRITEQAFTGFRRAQGQHPLAERNFEGMDGISTPKFNRGAVLNAALSTITHGQCVFTHDVDLVPIHDESGSPPSYDAYATVIPDNHILHLAGGWERYNPDGTLKFTSYLGGVAGMTPRGWRSVNGYPNDFFGWGGEDDELRNRVNETSTVVNDEYYDARKFQLSDLEKMSMEDKLESVQSKEERYNIVKNELVNLHRKKGGLGMNGLSTIEEMTRIISWNRHKEHSWIDTILVAILPSAYPILPPSTYMSIPEERLYGPKSNASYRALAKYGVLMGIGYNWGAGDTTEGMSEYDSIRAKETIYGPGMRSDHKSIKGWRLRLKGMRDATGSSERVASDGSRVSLHSQVWLDPTGAFSISYPETADAMASILASMVPPGSSIVDMTACVGGNSSYFSYYFRNVTAIEIAPHRQKILEHNLRLLHPGNEDQIITISPDALYTTAKDKRSKIRIVIGDSQEILTPNPSYKDLARADPLGQVLFLDPPWGGPNYMYLPRPLQLEMVTRDGGAVSAAMFLRPILERIRQEQQVLPTGRGMLSDVRHIGMKVPDEYDISGLRKILSSYNAVATDPFLIPDRTRKNRVYFIVMTLL
jgi:hypothetical protein